ncbi:hypothetical protein BDP27DRAFT_1413752 [Rhodocollybia butyracea]|uniref:Uncharacterized protein n=1 Tax=Rhodocollybia butyracea TaxID=206335 RepID=A0A9P5Q9G2_9AGAR|nr:hypothetical protein BDP27DRAFT_1413752 [Rhodocollybia butyracea]
MLGAFFTFISWSISKIVTTSWNLPSNFKIAMACILILCLNKFWDVHDKEIAARWQIIFRLNAALSFCKLVFQKVKPLCDSPYTRLASTCIYQLFLGHDFPSFWTLKVTIDLVEYSHWFEPFSGEILQVFANWMESTYSTSFTANYFATSEGRVVRAAWDRVEFPWIRWYAKVVLRKRHEESSGVDPHALYRTAQAVPATNNLPTINNLPTTNNPPTTNSHST